MLEDRRGHALPDPADAIARVWRIGFLAGLGGHRFEGLGFEGSIGNVRPRMVVDQLYPITGETLYNPSTFCVHITAYPASRAAAPDSI
ncbi:hypothetical protein BRDID11004_27630 [Bradyrhizobium diazoefficiens]|uniref:Uncharacterized protein n=1 Tax=Bradyrhizobium diazoefficiens TaxID=1355477 RepID=A0A810ATG5_9BRAD|nr:hypothetical protein F07S3_61620 [Bradyrhizobium diazoefficiens]BCA14014.1 hypothetical protein BDHF08_58610 [Bradyrhizobium diazoefficiens]BCE58424.1 hypothetical protein XF5B_59360 [Bradyrhizobium diazoefficiens]BCE67102.1 hypothetical protein XF6B_59010 [Bradyrhizobium diazoefficiens]BCE75728.1 hypothetical protein XF8B_58390 [Bradyrhizobium diazoefficiens]